MAIWRQILTALWCALQGGTTAWAVRESVMPMIIADVPLTDLPTPVLVTLACLAAIAAFSLAALIWIPLLIGAVVSTLVLLGYALLAIGDTFGFAGESIALLWYILIAAFFVIPSLAFVIWNHGEKNRSRDAQRAAAQEF